MIAMQLAQAQVRTGIHVIPFLYAKTELGVIFTGTEHADKTTVNVATDVVQTICGELGITPDAQEFYDLQTWLGFPGMRPGEYRLHELSVRSNGHAFRVGGWRKLEGEELEAAIAQIPPGIWQELMKLIS